MFDTVYTNHGSAYDPTTGVFTCPATGVYAFYMSLYTSSQDAFHGSLVHTGGGGTAAAAVNAFVDNSGSIYAGNQASNMLLVRCSAGDTVHVEAEQLSQQELFVGYPFVSFSGHFVGSF